MTDLLKRLEAATEGSRELDEHVFVHIECGGDYGSTKFAASAQKRRSGWEVHAIPHYTTSIDAALTLVPEGREWSVTDLGYTPPRCGATCAGHHADFKGKTPALALCIAALKARS